VGGEEEPVTHTMSPQSTPDVSLAQQLLAMTLGVAQTQVLCVAAQLGLADLVRDEPKTVEVLAAATGTHAFESVVGMNV
jgi:hypothetical protein